MMLLINQGGCHVTRTAAFLGVLLLAGCSDGELSDGCALTLAEFNAIQISDGFTSVANRFNLCLASKLVERSATGTRVEIWKWRDLADKQTTITVTFDDEKVASKAQNGLK